MGVATQPCAHTYCEVEELLTLVAELFRHRFEAIEEWKVAHAQALHRHVAMRMRQLYGEAAGTVEDSLVAVCARRVCLQMNAFSAFRCIALAEHVADESLNASLLSCDTGTPA